MGHTHRGAIGLAELLRALDDYDGDPPAHLVELLGYAPVERPPARKAPPPAKGKTGSEQRGAGLDTDPPPTSPDAEPEPHAPSTFWRATAYKPEQQAQHRERRIAATGSPPRRARWVIPPTRLAAFESLINPLRLALRQARLGTQADIPEAVRRISEGEWLAELPREMRAGWGTSLTVVEDRSPHLAPYRRDQGHVHDRLRRVFNPETFHAFLYLPPAELPQRPRSQSAAPPFDPRDGQQVLILGDLGVLIRDPVQRAHAQSRWRRLLSRLRSQGVHPVVLLPFDARDLPPDLAGNVVALSWRPGTEALPSPQWAAAQIERLLRHMAWIGRVEPPLLRALRVELGLPMAVESWAWQDPRVDASPGISASVRAEYAAGLRAQAELDHAHRDACLERVREHAGAYGYSLWLETVLNTLHLSATPARGDDIDHALRLLEHIAGRLEAEDVHAFVEPQWAWLRDFEQRWSRRLRDSERTREACRAIQAVVARQRIVDPKSIDEDEPPPTGAWQLVLHASRLRAFPAGSPPVSGSFVCEMSSTDALISIQAGEVEQASRTRDPDFWADGLAPDWASDWGHDGFDSPWCEFQIGAVTQRLRWCPPGEFLMGSPEHEPGRFDDEGPRHRVTLAEGYWIMDTPVTQALWLAVMWGDNPSQFQSPDRPVEQVSWEDAQGFVRRLEQRLPGLGLKLPSEAQWEYACRADARDEAYAGEIQLRGEAEAPGLEPVAWYGGNSEQGFELENGQNTYWRKEEVRAGTHPVKGKQANAWGLFDILGNVFEWVEDAWQADYLGAPVDGSPRQGLEAGGDRVFRGGSWFGLARLVRPAYRSGLGPGGRLGDLGFRLARVRMSSGGGAQAAQPARWRVGAQAEPAPTDTGRAQGDGSAPGVELLLGQSEPTVELPPHLLQAPALILRSDHESITLSREPRPDWAREMGRDRHGLYADVDIGGPKHPLRQRMRWCPPGRFTMGSPTDEPGRFDQEGPLTEVSFERGFWLADTPVTQAQWQAVMNGANPSQFRSPRRPVEQVSWDDCQGFIKQLGGEFALPSEAQWEYACRAGARTGPYTGEIDLRGDADAPGLEPVAWYSGNSEQGFELDNGQEPWPRNDGAKAGPHPVGQKACNDWGLFDMLGNVYEWVEDQWHDDLSETPADGSPRRGPEAGGVRVFRGGSWFDDARRVRPAFRNRFEPGFRYVLLGFRLARVRS